MVASTRRLGIIVFAFYSPHSTDWNRTSSLNQAEVYFNSPKFRTREGSGVDHQINSTIRGGHCELRQPRRLAREDCGYVAFTHLQ